MGILKSLAPAQPQRDAPRIGAAYHPGGHPALVDLFGLGAATTSGVSITPNNVRSCPEVDACIGLNEDTIATVPLDLFERTGEGERERAAGHRLHTLLHDRPNGWQTSAEFRQMVEGFRETHGNGYARIASSNRGPEALEPLHPDTVRPFFSAPGRVAYRWTPPEGGPDRILLEHEMLHLRDTPAQRWNLAAGESKAVRHAETIGRVMATGQYLSRFFRNNATPKSAIVVPGNLEDKQVDDLRAQWERRHGSLENAHRVAVMHSGMDIKTLGSTNQDAQMVEAYQFGVSQVARIYETPLHLIGEMSKATSWGTGIEQQSIGFVVYYMRPKFVIWEQALNRVLMSDAMRQRFYFEFNIDAMLRGDFKTRMEGYALMVQWGLATINEIRRLMNLPPLDGADERLQPLNMVPASRIMDVLLKTSGQEGRTLDADQATRMLAEIVARVANANKPVPVAA